MGKYTITESVDLHGGVEDVHSFEDLEKHHPSAGREKGRQYDTINGELEEVRHLPDGRTFIKKDLILSQDTPGAVNVPAPIGGYVHLTGDDYNTVQIFDRPFNEPGAVRLGQVLHMADGSLPAEGARVEYGEPLGRMGDAGTPGSVHAHVEVEIGQFQNYIRDIDNGTIQPGVISAMRDGVLRRGEQGDEIKQLQEALNRNGAQLPINGSYGPLTEAAVADYQRRNGLEPVDGIAGARTLGALGISPRAPATTPPVQTQTPPVGPTPSTPDAQTPTPPATPAPSTPGVQDSDANPAAVATVQPFRDSALSALISGGEGGYNSYNKGRAGDAQGAEIDFSAMTVGEIMRRQRLHETNPGDAEELFAVGKYQMTPETMREAVAKLGIDENTPFTPQLQDRLFSDYLVDEKRPDVRAYITGAGGEQELKAAQLALAKEFASVADPSTNKSYYDGDAGGNSASITAAQSAAALEQMREQYQQNVKNGMSPNEAYREVSTGDRNSSFPSALGGVLREPGGSPDDVRELQTALNRHGANLPVTGTFDPQTTEAVKVFQRSQNLDDDGIAGTDTLRALGIGQPGQAAAAPAQDQAPAQAAPPIASPTTPADASSPVDASCPVPAAPARADEPLMSDAAHPDHAMYRQALAGLEKLGPQAGLNGRESLERAAATMVYEARVSGLSRIDHIVQSADGTRIFAVQGELQDPSHRRVVADKDQATAQSVEQTTQALAQDVSKAPQRPEEQANSARVTMAH